MSSLNKLGMHAPVTLSYCFGANAEAVDTYLFTADDDYELVEAYEIHTTKGSDGSAVTLDILKIPSGTAHASGTSMLVTTFDLKSTDATAVKKSVSNGGVSQTFTTRLISKGQSLYAEFAGTTTAYVGGALTLVLNRISFSTER